MRGTQTTWAPQIIATAALLWALNPGNPYGYYIFLRWLCFGVFAHVAYLGNRCTNPVWRRRRRERRLGAWTRTTRERQAQPGQPGDTCSPATGSGGGTVSGPISLSSSAGSRRARVWAQYLGASSR
jgi:hypothetical protein